MAGQVKVTPVTGFKVLYGLQEIGSYWKVQGPRIRIHTYGCKIYVNGSLEQEFPNARTVPYSYELEAGSSVVWEIYRTDRTWVDQTIRELAGTGIKGITELYSNLPDCHSFDSIAGTPMRYHSVPDYIAPTWSVNGTTIYGTGAAPLVATQPLWDNIRGKAVMIHGLAMLGPMPPNPATLGVQNPVMVGMTFVYPGGINTLTLWRWWLPQPSGSIGTSAPWLVWDKTGVLWTQVNVGVMYPNTAALTISVDLGITRHLAFDKPVDLYVEN